MKLEKDRKTVENILGTPLPEIDPIYYEGAKIWKDVDVHPFITPYFMSKLYTVDEMKMVMALPGGAKEVSEKTGFDFDYCDKSLKKLFQTGKILPGRRYYKETSNTYTPTLNQTTLRDQIGMYYNGIKKDWAEEKEMFLLANAWHISTEPEDVKGLTTPGMRVIPKWESIKSIPGVMHCENMKEILTEAAKEGRVAVQRCVCKSHENLARFGKAILEDGGGCASGIKEFGNETGHCIAFDQRAKYFTEMFNAHKLNEEDALHTLKDCEDSSVVYCTKNTRQETGICTCCSDCCPIYFWYEAGGNMYQPSRFRPEVSEDKCVGCQICKNYCIFNAISYADGKCVINPNNCKGCGNCVVKCQTKALKMVTVHSPEWIPDIEDYTTKKEDTGENVKTATIFNQ